MAIGTWSRNFLNCSLSSALARSGVSSNCSTVSALSEFDVICCIQEFSGRTNISEAMRELSPKMPRSPALGAGPRQPGPAQRRRHGEIQAITKTLGRGQGHGARAEPALVQAEDR